MCIFQATPILCSTPIHCPIATNSIATNSIATPFIFILKMIFSYVIPWRYETFISMIQRMCNIDGREHTSSQVVMQRVTNGQYHSQQRDTNQLKPFNTRQQQLPQTLMQRRFT